MYGPLGELWLSMAGFEYGMTSSENHVKIGLKTDVSIQSFRILSSKNYVLHALKLLTYILKVFFSFFQTYGLLFCIYDPATMGWNLFQMKEKLR